MKSTKNKHLFFIWLIITMIIGGWNTCTAQTINPKNEDFNSVGGVGEWKQVLGPVGNTGVHNGELCYNVSGTYIDNSYYSFESDTLDLSLWFEVEATILISSNLRNGDGFYFYYLDSVDNLWYGWDISGAIGTYILPLPRSAKLLSFDLDTYSNGNLNGKYAHVDFIYLVDRGTSLPIELMSFDAELNGDEVDVKWSVASQINNDYYSILRSIDGYNWCEVGEVQGDGNNNTQIDYKFVDKDPYVGVSYYKLRQTDFDGNFEEFPPVSVSYDVEIIGLIVSPNPTKEIIKISMDSKFSDDLYIIKIFNSNGDEILNNNLIGNLSNYQIDVSRFTSGIYIVKVRNKREIGIGIGKFIKE
jgi:hypothetical protein